MLSLTSFSQIIGQEKAIEFLKRAITGGKVPHSYIFVGIPGIGKTTTAVALAQAMNCHDPVESEGCGRCLSCRQLANGNFPDLECIEADGQKIKIEQIKNLGRTFGFKPVSGKYRFTILKHAERLTEEAANAFLKTLEEPPEGNVLILTVVEPLDLLPTILSRCQKVHFRPISVKLVSKWLKEKKGVDEEDALVLARVAEGSLGRALGMSEGDFLKKRQEHIMSLIELSAFSPVNALEKALDYAVKGKKKLNADDGNEHEGLYGMLSIWKIWYRDMLLTRFKGGSESLINIDFSQKLKYFSKNFRIDDLSKCVEVLDRAQRDLLHNRNVDLVLETTFLTLREISNGKTIEHRRKLFPNEQNHRSEI